jgi:CRISPR-associated protein (Cas_Csd1)
MLRELYELSQYVNATLPPVGYGKVVAHVGIDVSSIVNVYALLQSDSKGKESLGTELVLPDFVRSSGDRPLPIADTASYVLGIGKDGAIRKPMYLNLLRECYDETQDVVIVEVLKAVELLDIETIRADCAPWFTIDSKKKDEDPLEKARFVFLYKGQLVTDRPSVKQFWERKYTDLRASIEGACCITGKHRLLVGATLPVMVKGVRGSQGKGAALMSFNFESVESRKWKDSEHAPLGFDVAERSHQMLNKLLQEERHHYNQGNNAFVFWGEYDTGLNPVVWDDPEELWDDDAATVSQMIFTTPNDPRGFNAEACQSTRFYLAILTGCDGRVAISRWDETTPQKIAENVTRHISTQKSITGYKARPIWQLAGSCFRDPAKEHVNPVVQALVMNALWGIAIPQSIVTRVLERIYLDLFSDKKDARFHSRYYSRFQILALYTNGMTNNQSSEMVRKLQIAQQLGAISYLIHDAEMTARNLDDPGKTGVAGSLRALASTPKQVFGRLYQNAILYHLPTPCNDGNPEKQESRRRRLKRAGRLLREAFGQLVDMGLSPDADLPTTFSLDESAWFYLGWGMREATFWAGVEREKVETETMNKEKE